MSPHDVFEIVRVDINAERMQEAQVVGQTLSWLADQVWFDRHAFTKLWISRSVGATPEEPQRISLTFYRLTEDELCILMTLREQAAPSDVERVLGELSRGEPPSADFTISSFRPWYYKAPVERTDHVFLHHGEITQSAIESLWARSDITVLYLCGKNATDDVLPGLVQNPIEQLHLNSSSVTDRGIVFLAEFLTLRELQLNGTPITDDTIDSLAVLPNLELLSLRDTDITDDGAMLLVDYPRLRRLVLPASVSQSCFESLQQAMPHCRITR